MTNNKKSIRGYEFNDRSLFELAVTHRSVSSRNNERLEFLGDSLLGFIISAEIMSKFPEADEGALTRIRASLVNGESLSKMANQLGIGEMILLGEGEKKSGGSRRPSILADVFESLIGAVFLDSNFETVKAMVLDVFKERLDGVENSSVSKDSKTILQEHLQSLGLPLPIYTILEESGPDHEKNFCVECKTTLFQEDLTASANSKRKAEQAAAALTLNKLGLI